jgi:hypothetical protein
MKSILKTLGEQNGLNYEDTFNSRKNLKIRHKLIPELQKSMPSDLRPSVGQLTKWLYSLHKSRRSQLKLKKSGKLTLDLRRLHKNSRLNDV